MFTLFVFFAFESMNVVGAIMSSLIRYINIHKHGADNFNAMAADRYVTISAEKLDLPTCGFPSTKRRQRGRKINK